MLSNLYRYRGPNYLIQRLNIFVIDPQPLFWHNHTVLEVY